MKNKFFYINKNFSEYYPSMSLDDNHFIELTTNFLEDNKKSEICYIDYYRTIENNFKYLIEYLEIFKKDFENRYLAFLVYDFQSINKIKKISKYFKETFYFSELRVNTKWAIELWKIDTKHVSLLPVFNKINSGIIPRYNLHGLPNKNVFISVWNGSDDLENVKKLIIERKDLDFFLPNKFYCCGSNNKKSIQKKIQFKFENLHLVESFTPQYLEAFNKCDVVFIPIFNKEQNLESVMRWGLRLSNALRGRKYIITTENYINRIVMAKNESTCLIVDWSKESIAQAFEKIYSWKFKINEYEIEKIRKFMNMEYRLQYIYSYIIEYDEKKKNDEIENFKFDKEYLKTLNLDEGMEIDEIWWITKWQKIESIIIYKITVLKEKKKNSFRIYILDTKEIKKIKIYITKKKQKHLFFKLNNWYFVSFEWRSTVVTENFEKFLHSIKKNLENLES